MTQEQLDALLTEWQDKVAHASENLLALDDVPALQRIEGCGGQPPLALTGVTAVRVTPALKGMRELFDQLGTLVGVVDKAARLRRSLNRLWHYEETLGEVERLLTGPSIPLPDIQTPLAKRGLVSASETKRAVTPDRLLTAMMSAFDAAKEAVLAVEAAWNRLEPALDAARTKTEALEQQALARSLPAPPELEEVRRLLAALQAQVASDPLGVGEAFERDLAPSLAAARSGLEETLREQADARSELDRAHQTRSELADAREDCRRSLDACGAAGFGVGADPEMRPRAPLDAARLAEMDEWLEALEETYRAGRWAALRAGLRRWRDAADSLRDAERDSATANRALLDLPAELQGRLSVLRVRAAARAAPADPALERLTAQAEEVLKERPLPLARAVKLVEACEARLRGSNRPANSVSDPSGGGQAAGKTI